MGVEQDSSQYVVRDRDWKIPVGVGLIGGVLGLEMSNLTIDFVKESIRFMPDLLRHPFVLAFQASTVLSSTLFSLAIGFDVEKWVNGK